jgi:hypothetical protein
VHLTTPKIDGHKDAGHHHQITHSSHNINAKVLVSYTAEVLHCCAGTLARAFDESFRAQHYIHACNSECRTQKFTAQRCTVHDALWQGQLPAVTLLNNA